jgi:hypothetical protein
VLKNEFASHAHLIETLHKLQVFTEDDFKLLNEKLHKDTPAEKKRRENELLAQIESSCFINSIFQSHSPKASRELIIDLMLNYPNKLLPASEIQEIINKYELTISVKSIDEDQTEYNHTSRKIEFKKSPAILAKPEIAIILFEHHYFLDYQTDITSYYVEHIKDLQPEDYNKILNHGF